MSLLKGLPSPKVKLEVITQKELKLFPLTGHTVKINPVPFFGMYRIIDFTLSNIMNSGISNVGVLTQYKPSSLIDHIQTGDSWDFYGRNRRATILPPYN
mgnify:CR=1 FL=1